MWTLAEITLSSRTIVRPWTTRLANGTPLGTFDASTCVSTALIQVGQIVQFDTTSTATHRLVKASTAGYPNLSTNMVGIAMSADTSDGSTTGLGEGKRPITVALFAPGAEFLFPTNISAVASTLVNTGLALKFDSTLNIHVLAANSTAGDQRFWVTRVINAGDTNGFVVAKPISTAVAPSVYAR